MLKRIENSFKINIKTSYVYKRFIKSFKHNYNLLSTLFQIQKIRPILHLNPALHHNHFFPPKHLFILNFQFKFKYFSLR